MEFNYKEAINERPHFPPPYGYFAEQALRAGYSANPEVMRHPGVDEAIQRRMEKERIREEIIASEIARRRALEDEVRREMMLEREMARLRAPEFEMPFDYTLGPNPWLHSRHHLDYLGIEDGLTFPGRGGRDFHLLRPPAPPHLRRPPPPAALGSKNEKSMKLARPDKNLAGTKRRTPPPPPAAAGKQSSSGLKKPKEWSCALCQVSATSENGLNTHLQCRKHKAKEAGIRAQRMSENSNIESLSKRSRKSSNIAEIPFVADELPLTGLKKPEEWSCTLCQISATSKKNLDKHLQGKKHKAREARIGNQTMSEDSIAGSFPKRTGKTSHLAETSFVAIELPSTGSKKFKGKWSCALCQVNARCEEALNWHLRGKMHKDKQAALRNLTMNENSNVASMNEKTHDGSKTEIQMEKKTRQDTRPEGGSDQKTDGREELKQRSNELQTKKNLKKDYLRKTFGKTVADRVKRTEELRKQKKFKFWCEMCSVGTYSQVIMDAHNKGKRHQYCLHELRENAEAVGASTASSSTKITALGSCEAALMGKYVDTVADEAIERVRADVPQTETQKPTPMVS